MAYVPNGLARAAVRFKPAAFAGTFVALMMASLIVAACGILLETGLRASVPPVRYAAAPVVAAADQEAHYVTGSGEDRTEASIPLPDRARLDDALVAKAAAVPGARTAVADVTFPVRSGDRTVTAHGWGSTAFTGEKLTTGRAARSGEVALAAPGARAATASRSPPPRARAPSASPAPSRPGGPHPPPGSPTPRRSASPGTPDASTPSPSCPSRASPPTPSSPGWPTPSAARRRSTPATTAAPSRTPGSPTPRRC